MAVLQNQGDDKVLTIKKFQGVNENVNGDTLLSPGEASRMSNFKITSEMNLQKRPGTQNVANLLFNYDIDVSSDKTTTRTETGTYTFSTTIRQNLNITEGGILYLMGTSATADYSTVEDYTGYYWQSETGNIYQLGSCDAVTTGTTFAITDGNANLGTLGAAYITNYTDEVGNPVQVTLYPSLSVVSGELALSGTPANYLWNNSAIVGKYFENPYNHIIYKIQSTEAGSSVLWNGYPVTLCDLEWNFYEVTVVPNTADSLVQGIWSGNVAGIEVICAACNNRLWTIDNTPIEVMNDNPSFYGTAGWTNHEIYMTDTPPSNLAATETAHFTATAGFGGIQSDADLNLTNGHKYYFRACVKSDAPLYVRVEDQSTVFSTLKSVTTLGTGSYETVSGTFTAIYPTYDVLSIVDPRFSDWTPVYVKYFFIVDLTAEYGSGLEPVQGWCDASITHNSVETLSWGKTQVGAVTTTNKVHMFGFDGKLYMLNGSQYLSWSGEKHTEHTRTCLGTESGNYYITVDSVNYKFALSSPTAGYLLVFSEYDLSLKLNGGAVSYTTGSVTTETNLTSSLVSAEVYDSPESVTGYRPLIAVAAPPTGGGTALQQVNKLNGLRRIQFSPTGSAATFVLPEKGLSSIDYVKYVATGTALSVASSDLTNGTVTVSSPPASGTSTVEVGYTFPTTYRSTVLVMTRSEQFNGANDNRVFIYGDGSNQAFYSDLEYETGKATAEYFPDLNVMSIGNSNTPITSLVRHYDRLLAYKADSAYSIRYDTLTLVSGQTVAGFYISTISKDIGCVGYGQAIVVGNKPRTLDGRSLYEWTPTTTSGNISPDQRNAERISKKVEVTLRELDFTKAILFNDKINHEFYIVENGVAIVQNTETGAWYVYRNFPAVCMIVYKDELYYGTATGSIRRVSRDYLHDVGETINCTWESGSMNFGADYMLKNSDSIWLVLKPEDDAAITVTVETDQSADYEDSTFTAEASVTDNPHTQRCNIRVKNFAWYKLLFATNTNNTTATVLSAGIKYRMTRKVR